MFLAPRDRIQLGSGPGGNTARVTGEAVGSAPSGLLDLLGRWAGLQRGACRCRTSPPRTGARTHSPLTVGVLFPPPLRRFRPVDARLHAVELSTAVEWSQALARFSLAVAAVTLVLSATGRREATNSIVLATALGCSYARRTRRSPPYCLVPECGTVRRMSRTAR